MPPKKKVPLIFTKDCGYVPAVLVNAGEIVERHISTENLFQVQGSTAKLKKLMSILSLQKMPQLKKFHVHDAVEVIKACLSRLSNELIPDDVMSLLIEANQSQLTDYTSILALYRRTSPLAFSAVHYTVRLLNKVIQHSDSNGMDARKLATIFVLDVLRPLTATRNDDQQQECDYEVVRQTRLEKLPYLIMVMEQLILQVPAFKKASVYRPEVKLKNGSDVETVGRKGGESVMGDTASRGTLEDEEGATCLNSHWPEGENLVCEKDGAEVNKNLKGDNLTTRSVSLMEKGTPNERNSTSGIQPTGTIKSCSTRVNERGPSLTLRRSTSELGTSYVRARSVNGSARRGGSLVVVPRSRVRKTTSSIKSKPAVPGWKGTSSRSLLKDEVSSRKKSSRKTALNRRRFVVVGGVQDTLLKKQFIVPFHQDEELLPWSNHQTESDDSSIMERSIRNPRMVFLPSEINCTTSKNDRSQKIKEPLPDVTSRDNGKPMPSKDPKNQATPIPSYAQVTMSSPSTSPNEMESRSTSHDAMEKSLSVSEASSPALLSGSTKEESQQCSGTFSLQRSDWKPQPARSSSAATSKVKQAVPHYNYMYKPGLAERHRRAQGLNLMRVPENGRRYMQRATDIVLLGAALFATYLLFLLSQWHQGDKS